MRSITDLILRMQPYPQKLQDLCNADSNFAKALKTINPKKFISLGAVVVSYPQPTSDEVIGFYVYDYGKNPMFKQDFIVNVGFKNTDFVIYTRFSGVNKNRIVRDISHFYQKYPNYPKNSHHPKFEDLPDSIKSRALDAIKLANRINALRLREEISEAEYRRYNFELQKLGL